MKVNILSSTVTTVLDVGDTMSASVGRRYDQLLRSILKTNRTYSEQNILILKGINSFSNTYFMFKVVRTV